MGLYLGLDSSTQSLSALVIDTDTGKIALDLSVNFGADLPEFESPNGFLPHPDPLVKHSDPLMWVAALELLLDRARTAGFDWSRVDGISGSGQQHGSVYLAADYATVNWQPGTSLVEQVRPCLSRASSPIWMDSSTHAECTEIGAAAGGDPAVTAISGSRPIERFTGPQIRKFYKTEPDAYANTARIHLVSSFMAWLLCGADAPIDLGDGAGMNLLDLSRRAWSNVLMKATAPGLAAKLPAVVPSNQLAGRLHGVFASRWGFRAGIPVVAWTGDNPSSLVGMGATAAGTAVISLGTSDTYFAAMSQPTTDPRGYGHVFGNPARGFMSLIAFKNGSLAREEVQKRFGLTWAAFSDAILKDTAPGNGGRLMMPFYVPEITPRVLKTSVQLLGGTEAFRNWQEPAHTVRAIVEAQALSMKRHSDWISDQPKTILVTGGASQNAGLLQVLADVFGATLQKLTVSNAAALGAALRAANAVGNHPFADLYATFSAPDAGSTVTPNPAVAPVYADMSERFATALAPIVD